MWRDHDRAARLLDVYNRRFNSHVPPAYDGTHLHLPGLGEHFSPRRTQRDAVARVLAEDTLLDHVVGAGKSGTMFMAAMEMRRRGLARQPWIVVPNHLVGQVAREAKQWYPAARVLAGPSATTAVSRREFTALTAVADFDLVIVPESLFTAIPVSARTRERYINDQLAALAAAKRERSTS